MCESPSKHPVTQYSPFDQNELLRLHALHILPLMSRAELHAQCLSFSVGVAESGGHQVLLEVNSPVVAERKGPVPCGVLDRPPEVDDLVAVLQKLWNVFGGEVSVDTRKRGLGSLVDMDVSDRLTLAGAVVDLTRTVAANGYAGNGLIIRCGALKVVPSTYCDQMGALCLRLLSS